MTRGLVLLLEFVSTRDWPLYPHDKLCVQWQIWSFSRPCFKQFAVWLFFVFLFVFQQLFFDSPAAFAAASQISGITPSCAAIGEQVTITGNGFGAQDVIIKVSEVVAQLISATGNRVTFIVPVVTPPGVTTVTATNPGGHTGSIAFRVRGVEICGNQIDEDCDGQTDDLDVCVPVNHHPSANAGADQTAPTGITVHLDGTASSDPDGNTLSFQWTFFAVPPGSTTTMIGANTPTPSFPLDKAGTYIIQLIVNDGHSSSTDKVVISTSNSAPVANAGPNQRGFVGVTLTLDGSASSDVDGDALSYQWTIVATPADSIATLSDPLAVTPTFTIDKAGDYTLQLVVSDGQLYSAPNTVELSTLNSPPVADAGLPQSGHVGETIILDGSSSSDVDGNPLSYQWSLSSRPTNSTAILLNPTTPQPSFLIDKAGTYAAQLIVNDGIVDSDPDHTTVSTHNSKPVAFAGADQSSEVNTVISLDGRASTDVDGDSLTYQWSFTTTPADSAAALTDATSVAPSFTLDKPGTYVVQLMVSDGTLTSDPARVTITTLNSKPVANAGLDREASAGTTVQLDGSNSHDVDGDPLTYLWSLITVPNGSMAGIVGETLSQASFVPDTSGLYVVQLIVNDGQVNSDPDTATVTVIIPPDTTSPPPADLRKITVDPGTDGQITITGGTGSVEGNARVTITNIRTGQAITVTATATGSFTALLAAQPGTVLSIVAVDVAGNTSTASYTLVTRSAADPLDAQFQSIWDGMNTALLSGDKVTALSFLTVSAQRKYESVFDRLLPYMPQIIVSYSPLQRVSVSADLGEYAIMRVIDGQLRLFLIYFSKDVNGMWRLDAM